MNLSLGVKALEYRDGLAVSTALLRGSGRRYFSSNDGSAVKPATSNMHFLLIWKPDNKKKDP